MSEISGPANLPAVVARRVRADYEFLPAALELLETPPSPNNMVFMMAICAFVIVGLVWSYFGHIDIIAVAQGKIQPSGHVKVIEPLETGKVMALHVSNGMHVNAGAVLVELEPMEAIADESEMSSAYESYKAEAIRRLAAISFARDGLWSHPRRLSWNADIPPSIQHREQSVLNDDLAQLAAQIGSLNAQLQEKRTEKASLQTTIAAQEVLITTLQERVNMRRELMARGAESKANVIDALEAMQTQQTSLASLRGQLAEAVDNIGVLGQEREKIIKAFISDNGQKYDDAARQRDDYAERLAKAHVKREHMTLKSPVAGTVTALSITTLGQVVSTGEEIMRIVPDDARLEIQCYLENKDIGFVKKGQKAQLKIASFPFTQYGTINAIVINVARDAIPEADAEAIEQNPEKSSKNTLFDGGERVQNLVFPVTLLPAVRSIHADGVNVPLSPGMSVEVDITTGRRRIIDYLFSPLVETTSQAMHER